LKNGKKKLRSLTVVMVVVAVARGGDGRFARG
jgi:hypothetical protein